MSLYFFYWFNCSFILFIRSSLGSSKVAAQHRFDRAQLSSSCSSSNL
ncbi:hypothetical protein SEVIR_9G286701v4 [Setaria viridis]|uniref:Uncharacterized protein n=1 Tax=Setaria viridis TaxID=4556 RepID=A0A4V6D1E2_SETVI|nr:hypothetical protein SEVIR_9G286701v2 [Setaria viridis]